jgi:HD-GYP domain-containing protein (c-di-GMP phosphodiesterase class II)
MLVASKSGDVQPNDGIAGKTRNDGIRVGEYFGRGVVKPVDQLAGSLPSILHHHERYDGRGYPKGLKGDEIPLAARIIAVADTFDAISSDRAYRAGKSLEATIAIVEEVSGSQLDPRVVAAFKKVYKAGLTQEKEEESC